MRTTQALATLLALAVLAAGGPRAARAQTHNVALTRHNLSSTGPGGVRSSTESEICVFCHTPHAAQPVEPLWGHDTSITTSYQMYTSTTFTAASGGPYLPSGSTRLCLSCHDGTVALGALRGRTVTVGGTDASGRLVAGPANLTTNLRDDHPVSFPYSATTASDPDFRPSPMLPVELENGRMECSSCHEPHSTAADFLRDSPRNGALCNDCHAESNWGTSTHATSTRVVTAGTTVAQEACASCHRVHAAVGSQRLLLRDSIEAVCYRCHGTGSTIATDIRTSATGTYAHRVTAYESQHQPVTVNPALENTPVTAKHVECTDCHDGHRAGATSPSGPLQNVMGVSTSGAAVRLTASDPEYMLCFRCHAFGGETVTGTGDDKYVHFGTTAPASGFIDGTTINKGFHPVVQQGRGDPTRLNTNSLAGGLTSTSLIRCSDCHASQTLAGDSGQVNRSPTSVEGPHGSTSNFLLRGNYTIAPCLNNLNQTSCDPYNGAATSAFSLCFACHRVGMWTNSSWAYTNYRDGSNNLHEKHSSKAGCPECHWDQHSNAHGSSHTDYQNIAAGLAFFGRQSTALVNFAPSVAPYPTTNTRPIWGYDATQSQRLFCSLNCHGRQHTPERYQ